MQEYPTIPETDDTELPDDALEDFEDYYTDMEILQRVYTAIPGCPGSYRK